MQNGIRRRKISTGEVSVQTWIRTQSLRIPSSATLRKKWAFRRSLWAKNARSKNALFGGIMSVCGHRGGRTISGRRRYFLQASLIGGHRELSSCRCQSKTYYHYDNNQCSHITTNYCHYLYWNTVWISKRCNMNYVNLLYRPNVVEKQFFFKQLKQVTFLKQLIKKRI